MSSTQQNFNLYVEDSSNNNPTLAPTVAPSQKKVIKINQYLMFVIVLLVLYYLIKL